MDPNPIWYGRHPLGVILAPLSWLYCLVVQLRRLGYRKGWLASRLLPVPVVVVGNLTVGGTGKTPAVLKLAELLRARGWRPGIITRGYRGRGSITPRRVPPDGEPADFGDEPVLLARRSGCPVVAGPDRVAAGALALSGGDVDILLADDGLQHYRLARDIEIAVVDGARGLGNGRCLPAGPLREPRGRLTTVDLVLTNGDGAGDAMGGGYRMRLIPGAAVNLRDPAVSRPIADFIGRPVFAVAAIGNPERFFAMLRGLGLEVEGRVYPDHYPFAPSDLMAWPAGPVLMTEKDAVKCARFASEDHWFLPVEAELDTAFVEAFFRTLEARTHV
ncbi:tetraacyldisaccharide 4'-kinase [Thiocapsa roseopersicina]|uniref:Tetraacyldisaccharide 4'-kinase n=1 Tax=Thiocapsa roseopersicina TaxID=1058 RepID=A0A1H2S3Z6_THIRO|nr:tetraacyldisaccharide 4'-kinase [Thiocapsa roseopersicina]SDW26452.1 lipid-A-disaccharide kinase [Thiocapsa roseopersicina]